MHTIKVDYDVSRPADEVFAYLTDFGQITRWRSLDSMGVEPELPLRVGSQMHSAITANGRHMHYTHEVVTLDPASRTYADRFLSGSFPIQSRWQVEPLTGSSRIHWVTEFEARGLMKLFTPMIAKSIRQGQLDDLAKLKQILEQP